MMPIPRIRPARLEDIRYLLSLERTSFAEEAFSRRQLRYLIMRSKGIVLVAQIGSSICGYLSLLLPGHRGYARIYSLAVDAAYRGHGVAASLLDRAEEYAVQMGKNTLFLEVGVANHAALALYQKKGFEKRLVKPAYYKDGSDAYSMFKRVQPEKSISSRACSHWSRVTLRRYTRSERQK